MLRGRQWLMVSLACSLSACRPLHRDPGVCGGEMDVYVEPYMNTASLLIIGAGHVGRAVSELAQWTGWDVHLWDDRPEQLEELDDAVTPHGGELSEVLADIPLTSIGHCHGHPQRSRR